MLQWLRAGAVLLPDCRRREQWRPLLRRAVRAGAALERDPRSRGADAEVPDWSAVRIYLRFLRLIGPP
eukprot:2329571-Pyramimonas_sp.AAC.1